jgi:hypothetical protein
MSLHYITSIAFKIRELSVIAKEANSLYGNNIKTQFSHIIFTGRTKLKLSDFCCDNERPDRRDVQAALNNRMVHQRHVGWFLVFPMCGVWFSQLDFRLLEIHFVSFVRMLGRFNFSYRLCVRLYLFSSMRTSKGLLLLLKQTSATVPWDVVHTLLRFLGILNRSTLHQCSTKFMFSFENGPYIETVSSASQFLGNILNIWDHDCALVQCISRTVALDGFIMESTNSCNVICS